MADEQPDSQATHGHHADRRRLGDDEHLAANLAGRVQCGVDIDIPETIDQLIGLALAQTGTMPSEAEMEQTVTLARMFGPALLEGIVVELVEGVGLDTGYLVATDFVFDWDLSDLAALTAMTGGAALEVDEGAAIMASIVTTNTSVNEDVEIEVPADATIIPTEMLTGAMGQ